MMVRQRYIVGNWKMNQGLEEIGDFFGLLEREDFKASKNQVWIAPQSLHLFSCLSLAQKVGISLGAQNCSSFLRGAYTGEISPKALKEMGAVFTLLGHSERRTLFGETHKLLRAKALSALEQGLKVVFCVGETLEERESGQAFSVLSEQILLGLGGVLSSSHPIPQQLILAYEPIWAIGTGKAATSTMANEAHRAIRKGLVESLGPSGEDYSILYGGSVKGDNVEELLSQEHIDGALVGGASLKASDFKYLVQVAEATYP